MQVRKQQLEHGHRTDLFQIGKAVRQGCNCHPYYLTEYVMQNARLGEAQTGIKIAGRNINNLRYTDDTILMEEREEELKSLLMKVKEVLNWLKTQHSKN